MKTCNNCINRSEILGNKDDSLLECRLHKITVKRDNSCNYWEIEEIVIIDDEDRIITSTDEDDEL